MFLLRVKIYKQCDVMVLIFKSISSQRLPSHRNSPPKRNVAEPLSVEAMTRSSAFMTYLARGFPLSRSNPCHAGLHAHPPIRFVDLRCGNSGTPMGGPVLRAEPECARARYRGSGPRRRACQVNSKAQANGPAGQHGSATRTHAPPSPCRSTRAPRRHARGPRRGRRVAGRRGRAGPALPAAGRADRPGSAAMRSGRVAGWPRRVDTGHVSTWVTCRGSRVAGHVSGWPGHVSGRPCSMCGHT